MFISVIVPTYYDWDRLQLCLIALERQNYKKDKFEIIVVNNAPDDPLPSTLKIPSNCIVLSEGKSGSYAARNKALKVAKGEVYAFTDSDCQPQEDWLSVAVDFFMKNPDYDRIGGNIEMIMKSNKPNWLELYEKAFAFEQKEFVRSKGMAATGNMIAKKRVFDAVGEFNDSLMSGGDAEWGIRANEKNYKIAYVNECVVWHPTRDTFSDLAQKTKREAGGIIQLQQKKGKVPMFVSIMLDVFPPVNGAIRTFNRSDLSLKEKLIAITIRYRLKLISAVEKIKIICGKKVERV